ncbi:MAG: PAS domain S-box protein [Gemmatimonadota bacterium]
MATRKTILRYLVAVGLVAAATGLRLALTPIVGSSVPLSLTLIGVALAAWYGGNGPGLLALILGGSAVLYFLLPPAHSFDVAGEGQVLSLIAFCVMALGAIALIDSQRRARLRSEAESGLLRTTLESIGDGIITTDSNNRITRLNATAEALTGWSNWAAVGQPLETVFRIVHEESREPIECLTPGERRTEGPRGPRYPLLISKDGSERLIEESCATIRNDDGQSVGLAVMFRDVTDRYVAAAALRESEATLRAFYDTSPACMGIVEATADGDLLHIYDNPASSRFFGAEPGTMEGKRSLADLGVDPADLERRLAHYAESKRTGKPVQFDQAYHGPQGTRLLAATVCPIGVGPTGQTRFCFVGEDVTERRAAEAALSSSEERLRLALEAGGMGVWDWDIQTGALSWTEQLEPLHGLEPGTFRGTFDAFQELILEADRERVGAAISRAVQACSGFQVEFRNRRSNGDIVWIAGTGRAIPGPDGRAKRMIGIGLDVTQRRRAQQTSQFLADASAALAVPTDLDSILQKVAAYGVPYFADWIAIDFLEADGKLRRIATAHIDPAKLELAKDLHDRFPPDLSAPQGVGNILRTGKPEMISTISRDLLTESIRDPDQLRIAQDLGLRSYIGVPLTVRGRTLGAITFIAAESGHRYDEKDLAVAADLARRAGIAIENSQLYGELQRADRRKDEFLATLAHELRNPLAPISNSLALMRQATENGEVVVRARGAIERQLSQLVRLVDDLLDVSRITRDRLELKRGRIELASVVHHAVDGVRHLCERFGHELSVKLPAEPVYLDADPVRLAQLLGNLLLNACKYTLPGGRIALTAESEPGEVVIAVRDNGIGITREMLPQVFDLFTQANRSKAGGDGGLGIGLSLVKRLTELHYGTVTAHSDGPGLGSEFVVRLPMLDEPATEPAAETPTKSVKGTGRRVLVVDDNRDSADSLAMLLEMEGHETRTAYDGDEALARAEEFRPELILLDIGLPKKNGYEVCRAIRAQSWGKPIVVIAQTGWGQAEDRRRSREEGFDSHLVKPIDHGALRRLLAASFGPSH